MSQKKEIIKERIDIYNHKQAMYLKDLFWWQTRINTVEYYLSLLKPSEREYIEDLYIRNIKLKCVKEKYGIEYDSDLYRKSNHILKRIL